jgi:hypothetical protein
MRWRRTTKFKTREEGVMNIVVAVGLLLMTILAAPTASLAAEAVGIRHTITCLMCAPDITESLHITRSTGAASVVVQVNVYDANGIVVGSFIQADPAGTFLAQQIAFTSSQVLASAGLPAGLYAGILFDASLTTNLFYEQVALNDAGVAGILTGRGNLYNYFTSAAGGIFALTLYPEVGTGLLNFFVCNNPANNMATFLGVPGPAPGAQALSSLVTAGGNLVQNNFPTQNLFARPLSQISPAGPAGGSLFIFPPGATVMACVKFIRITGNGSVAGYTY